MGNFLTICKPVSFSRRTLHHGVSKSGVMSHCTVIEHTRFVFADVSTFLVQGPRKWNLARQVKLALILGSFSEYDNQGI